MSNEPHMNLERYHAARTLSNPTYEHEETLYHKRQRLALENSRAQAYKQTLVQSKRREWSKYRRPSVERPIRLSSHVRQAFQITERIAPPSPDTPSPTVTIATFPVRSYPPTCTLRQVTSQQALNIDALRQIRFLGQFDRKFLVTKRFIRSSERTRVQLILLDQHAISERILLERLQAHFQADEPHANRFHLSQPAAIRRNPRFLYTPDQIALLERTGFIFSSISAHNLLVRAVPGWLPSLGQRQASTSLLDDIISHSITQILATTNTDAKLIMYDTLKSLACHNAIKFNDVLPAAECRHLLSELTSCSMPFICAHGRTSAAILWECEAVEDEYKVDMTELNELASIHKWLKDS